MAASVQQIDVASEQQLESTIASYIAQGYVVSNRSAGSVTLFKKKEFNILWAVIGFFLCLLPLIVYCIVYATQSDQMIIVNLRTGSDAGELAAGELTWSEDREWWWDGRQWRDALREIPPGAVLSEDGASWWDGKTWRKAAVAATPAEPQAAEEQRSSPSSPPGEGPAASPPPPQS
jgi:hypothetical protein